MNYCTQCGNQMEDGATVCPKCGASVQADQASHVQGYVPTTHDVPKCTCCGHVGPWKVKALFGPLEIILAIVFLCMGVVPGLIYIGVHIARFGNKNNRAKYCAKCKAKNLFTFLY